MDILEEEDYELQAYNGFSARKIINTLLKTLQFSVKEMRIPTDEDENTTNNVLNTQYLDELKKRYMETVLETVKEFQGPIKKLFEIPNKVKLDLHQPYMKFEDNDQKVKNEIAELEQKIIQMKTYEKFLVQQLNNWKVVEPLHAVLNELSKKDFSLPLKEFHNLVLDTLWETEM